MNIKDVAPFAVPILSAIGKAFSFNPGRYKNFFDRCPYMFCIANGKGIFLDVNQKFASDLGYKREDLIDKPFLPLVHPLDRANTLQEMENLEMGGDTIGFKNRYRHGNGHWVTVEWFCYQNGVINAAARIIPE